jgi:hypothetical protein
MADWREHLTEEERLQVIGLDQAIESKRQSIRDFQKTRRTIQLRAMQRNHRRMQKVVDTGMEKA